VKLLYPLMIVTPDVVGLVDRFLERDIPGPIRRSLLESQDGTKREVRTRALDSSRPSP
jgi:hypothetical protein